MHCKYILYVYVLISYIMFLIFFFVLFSNNMTINILLKITSNTIDQYNIQYIFNTTLIKQKKLV